MHKAHTAMMAGLAMAIGAVAVAQPDRTQPQRGNSPGQPGLERQPPGQQRTPPGQELTRPGQQITPQEVTRIIGNWPQESQKAAREMIEKYGPPNGVTPQMLIWHNNGPWKKTYVHAEPHEHHFPMQHRDVLHQTIGYEVPIDKIDDLAQFDGSLIYWRTGGELSAICDQEPMNFLALNLAHDVATGKRTPDEARQFFAQTAKQHKEGRPSSYTQGLTFETNPNAGDPDTPVEAGSGANSPTSVQPAGARPGSQPPATTPGSAPGGVRPNQPR